MYIYIYTYIHKYRYKHTYTTNILAFGVISRDFPALSKPLEIFQELLPQVLQNLTKVPLGSFSGSYKGVQYRDPAVWTRNPMWRSNISSCGDFWISVKIIMYIEVYIYIYSNYNYDFVIVPLLRTLMNLNYLKTGDPCLVSDTSSMCEFYVIQ